LLAFQACQYAYPAAQVSRSHLQTSIKNTDMTYPREQVVVNLVPAAARKESPAYDQPWL